MNKNLNSPSFYQKTEWGGVTPCPRGGRYKRKRGIKRSSSYKSRTANLKI